MTLLRAVAPEEASRVVTGREVVQELVAVLERQIPFLLPNDPRAPHIRDLHTVLSVGLTLRSRGPVK